MAFPRNCLTCVKAGGRRIGYKRCMPTPSVSLPRHPVLQPVLPAWNDVQPVAAGAGLGAARGWFGFAIMSLVLAGLLIWRPWASGADGKYSAANQPLRVFASVTPHAEILKYVNDDLAQGKFQL